MSSKDNKTVYRRVERRHRDDAGAEVTNGTWGKDGPLAKFVDQQKQAGKKK